jgi:phosphosulfolactate synthase
MSNNFLSLPVLTEKPRSVGLTHVLDKGISLGSMESHLSSYAEFADVWKFGWGTAYVEKHLASKIGLLREHGITACLGGTLLEIAWSQGRVSECLNWAEQSGFTAVEVSRGVADMGMEEKWELIRTSAQSFRVFAETGYKSAERLLTPTQWHSEITGDLAAGAEYIVAEGRESGTVGVYDSHGTPQTEVIDAALLAAGLDRVLFEAPRKDQQAWFINTHGPEVNVGNVAPEDLLPLQTLRLGLRADTALVAVGIAQTSGVRT